MSQGPGSGFGANMILPPVGGGGVVHFGRFMMSGYQYLGIQGLGGFNIVVGQVYLCPFDVPYPLTIDGLVYITDAFGAPNNSRMGIWDETGAMDIADGGVMQVESASVPLVANNRFGVNPVVATALNPGQHWLGIMGDNVNILFRKTDDLTLTWARNFANSIGYGALDTPIPVTGGTQNTYPILGIRIASVP